MADAIPMNWPMDPEGKPMAIVMAYAKEHVGSGQGLPEYAGIDIGPMGAMVPCVNTHEEIDKTMRYVQRLSQYIIGTERRSIQWAMHPELKPQSPEEIEQELAEEAAAKPG